MNVLYSLPECSAPLDHYATALAHTQQMHADLNAAHDKIAEQDVTIGRLQDRITMLVDALDKSRYSELNLRKLLIELAVQQTNISLLARKAEECVAMIDAIDKSPVPESDALVELEAQFTKGNEA